MPVFADQHCVSVDQFPIWIEAAEGVREELGTRIIYDCHDWLSGFEDIASEIVKQERSHAKFRGRDLLVPSAPQ